jgi:large subunit ribosomal protein L14
MLKKGTRVKIMDNTGAKEAVIFGFYGGTRVRSCRVGDKVKVAIKSALPTGKVKKHEVQLARIIGQKTMLKDQFGVYSATFVNAAVIINNDGSPVGKICGYVHNKARKVQSKNDAFKLAVSSSAEGVY